MPQVWLWVVFCGLAVTALAFDLGLFHRKAHAVTPREAATWSAVWVTIALILAFLIFQGRQRGLEFLTGYLIELSLSVDNIFVFALIFAYFRVPPAYQHRVLFWGIVGAVLLRGLFIIGGIVLLHLFHWLIYILGALLVWGGIQLLRQEKAAVHPEKNRVLRLFRRAVPMLKDYDGASFIVRREGFLMATPLMAVLIVVETTDVVFALDSIPAILAITRDPFIVFTSNICAILGLRSLYFLFAVLVDRLRYLRHGLAVVLTFVGIKMLLSSLVDVPIGISLGVVAVLIGLSVTASLVLPETRKKETQRPEPGEEP